MDLMAPRPDQGCLCILKLRAPPFVDPAVPQATGSLPKSLLQNSLSVPNPGLKGLGGQGT